MAMTAADAIKWLRSGHLTENIMIKVTLKPVLDEAPASCVVSQWPLLCANSGILRFAQTRHVDSNGDLYHGLINRITGIGSRLDGLLIGEPKSLNGMIRLVNDASPMMREFTDIDVSGSKFEARTAPVGTDWDDAFEIGHGAILDMSNIINSDDFSIRVRGNEYLLNEEVWFDKLNDLNYNHTWKGAATFGYLARHPVGAESKPALTGTMVSNYLVCLWACDDHAYRVWGDKSYTSNIGKPYNPYGDYASRIDLDDSHATTGAWKDDWEFDEIGTVTFNRDVFASIKGYNVGGFLDHAGEIFQKAVSIANKYDNSSFPNDPALEDVTIDVASFDAYDINHNFQTGVCADAYDLSHKTPDWAWTANVIGKNGTWSYVLNTLLGGTGGTWSFSRDNKLQAHRFLSAPVAAESIAISRKNGDYEEIKIVRVSSIDGAIIEHVNRWPNGSKGYSSHYGNTYAQDKSLNVETLKSSIADGGQCNVFGNELVNRFGTFDLRLDNCPIAKSLSIGDVVRITDDKEAGLESGLIGWVTGVDRGSEPFVEVRV